MSVLVYVENWDGKFKKSSFELVSYAFAIAQQNGQQAMALSIGNVPQEELEKLSLYGASKVVTISGDPFNQLDSASYAKAISKVAEANNSTLVIMAHNNTGKGLAPRVTVRMNAGLASGVTALPLSLNPFILRKNVFNGKAYGQLEIKSDHKVLTLSQNSFEIIENNQEYQSETFDTGIQMEEFKTKVLSVDKETDKLLLGDAEIVVSAGRGMKGPENWGPVEELAQVLGAATACSRPVSDEGWRGHEEHVGQTGKVIAPNLYFALGISGAIQHLAGVSSSKVIVAVNTDAEAPMFGAADYGIIGDLKDVLPKLVEEAKAFKASN